MTKTLYYAGTPGEGYGWGVANTNLIRELGKLHPLELGTHCFSRDAFIPIADHDLCPIEPIPNGVKRVFGYTFFEFTLGPKAAENAKLYDLIFCGSTWCKERLAEIGVHHTEVLVQGVDHEIFRPVEGRGSRVESGKEFRIFSGGKFEYRKGQDIVLAAFKLLQGKYPDMRLVASWFNPWPQLINGMRQSPHITMDVDFDKRCSMEITQGSYFEALLKANGVFNYEWVNQCNQRELADVMRSTDLGVFPNRCEGGTNLVLMEYLACGKPAIATKGTGHTDLIPAQWEEEVFSPIYGEQTDMRWVECDPYVLASRIERVYAAEYLQVAYGVSGARAMKQWTWRRAAEQIVSHL